MYSENLKICEKKNINLFLGGDSFLGQNMHKTTNFFKLSFCSCTIHKVVKYTIVKNWKF